MKIVVVRIVGGLLLCAAAAGGGYYAGKSPKPISQIKVEMANADREYFTRNLIEVKTDMSDVLNSTDAFSNLKQIARRFRVASGKYLLALKKLPDSSKHTIERNCFAQADEAIDELKLAIMSVDSCEHAYFRTTWFCSSKEKADVSDEVLRKTDEANDAIDQCLGALLDAPTATVAVSR
jgi:hypothetical protein